MAKRRSSKRRAPARKSRRVGDRRIARKIGRSGRRGPIRIVVETPSVARTAYPSLTTKRKVF